MLLGTVWLVYIVIAIAIALKGTRTYDKIDHVMFYVDIF